MSRTGKLPIAVPPAVKVSISGSSVVVEGPTGKLSKTFHSVIQITHENGHLHVNPREDSPFARAMHGTARSILFSMVKGVVESYVKNIEIQGTGFKAVLKGHSLDLSLGYSHPIVYDLPENVKITLADNGTKIKIEGPDKHMVGQVAAHIKQYYPVEPYKGKGVRIVGEFVRRKEGKKTA